MDDLISRQAAIDALDKHCDVVCQYSKKQREVMCGACTLGTAFDVIEGLPSAQPEVVRCKDCKYKIGAECTYFANVRPFPDDFCSRAERRKDE